MLRKLLKYDLRASFKYWWILALISIPLSVVGGAFLATFINSLDVVQPSMLDGIAVFLSYFGLLACIVLLSSFMIGTEILIFIRFYKNLFTDEGYLTFTLPAKRSQVLLSKLIMSVLILLSTGIVLVVDFSMMLGIGFFPTLIKVMWTPQFWQNTWRFIVWLFEVFGGIFIFVYAIEALILGALYYVFFVLVIFTCITVGATIVRKAKIFAGIGLYLVVNFILTSIVEIIYTFGSMALMVWLVSAPALVVQIILAIVLLFLTIVLLALCLMLYAFLLWLIDKKLNLA